MDHKGGKGGGYPYQGGSAPPNAPPDAPPPYSATAPPQPQWGAEAAPYPPGQSSYQPPSQPYPPHSGSFPPYGYPPQAGGYPPPQAGGYPPPQAGGYPPNPQYPPHAGHPAYPTQPSQQPQKQVVVKGLYDSGARFNNITPANIPPPPPGCTPNAAQQAAMQGHTVVGTQKKQNFWFGSDGGGYTW